MGSRVSSFLDVWLCVCAIWSWGRAGDSPGRGRRTLWPRHPHPHYNQCKTPLQLLSVIAIVWLGSPTWVVLFSSCKGRKRWESLQINRLSYQQRLSAYQVAGSCWGNKYSRLTLGRIPATPATHPGYWASLPTNTHLCRSQ